MKASWPKAISILSIGIAWGADGEIAWFQRASGRADEVRPVQVQRERERLVAALLAIAPPVRPAQDLEIRLSQRRAAASGHLLPHQLTFYADGQVVEEWVIDRFEVNGALDPHAFALPAPGEPAR